VSESIVADFTARVGGRGESPGDPARCRVVMNETQLVIATEDDREVIPLESVFDVVVGRPPGDVAEFFDDSVTLAYRDDVAKAAMSDVPANLQLPDDRTGERTSITLLAPEETVDRFTTVLFKTILENTAALVAYRARAGGRIMDQSVTRCRLHLADRTVVFRTDTGTQRVDVESVVDFTRSEKEFGGETRPVISVRHVDGRDAITSEIALPSERKLNVLGRYLRLVYSDLVEDLADLEITDPESEVLVARYTSGADVNLASVLGIDASRTTMLLDSLVEKGLLADDDERSFTSRGLLVVNRRLESVN
jgi:Uncharacterized conserved protein